MFRIIALSLVAASSTLVDATERPNIVFILADDWGTGDIKAYGGDSCRLATPQMDRLAAEGMMFTDAHSSSSVCTPTRYGVLTGRYNWRSRLKRGVLRGFDTALIEADRVTVPAFLKEHGYHTAAIGKWHLGMDFPTRDGKPAQSSATTAEEISTKCNVDWTGPIANGPTAIGFDRFWGISASLDMPPYIWINDDRFVGTCTTIKSFPRPGPAEADFEDFDVLPTLAEKAVAYVCEQSRTAEPFFLYMPLNSPHTPISPSKAWKGRSELGPYGDFVMETDDAIGRVVSAIDESGIGENTLIIVTADNGCSPAAKRGDPNGMIAFRMGEATPSDVTKHYPSHIYRGHKADIYEGGHRVPFLARWPGRVAGGRVCDQPVCLVDLFATCADLLDVSMPDAAGVDSFSLLPLLSGQSDGLTRQSVVHHSIDGSFAIRRGQWKLALCYGSGGWSDPRPAKARKNGSQAPQLYDLNADIAETTNVASEHPDVVEELTALLTGYVERGRSTEGPTQENNGAVEFELSKAK